MNRKKSDANNYHIGFGTGLASGFVLLFGSIIKDFKGLDYYIGLGVFAVVTIVLYVLFFRVSIGRWPKWKKAKS